MMFSYPADSHPESRQVGDKRCVKVDDAPIYELHHGDGRKHLAHRADAEHRGVGWHLARVAIGQAEALAPNDALVIHEGDRDRGGALIDELLGSGLPFLNRSILWNGCFHIRRVWHKSR